MMSRRRGLGRTTARRMGRRVVRACRPRTCRRTQRTWLLKTTPCGCPRCLAAGRSCHTPPPAAAVAAVSLLAPRSACRLSLAPLCSFTGPAPSGLLARQEALGLDSCAKGRRRQLTTLASAVAGVGISKRCWTAGVCHGCCPQPAAAALRRARRRGWPAPASAAWGRPGARRYRAGNAP